MAPPPPHPPPAGVEPDPTSPRSSHSSFVLDGRPEPWPATGQLTPEMWDAVRMFMEAGGYEGMKKKIVEESESLSLTWILLSPPDG